MPENIGFSFVAPRDLPKAQNRESFAASNQPEEDDCVPEDTELSPAKKIKVETLAETDPEMAKFSEPPQIPFRVVPVSLQTWALKKFTGIPMGRFSVNLDCDANLGRLLASDSATRVNLVWASTGLPCRQGFVPQESRHEVIPVQHFVNVVLKSESLYLPARIEPALQTLSAIESLSGLVATSNRQQKNLKLVLVGDDEGNDVGFPPTISSRSFKIDIFASDRLCEFDNPSELPRKSESSQNCRALVEGLYPGTAAPTPDENSGWSPGIHVRTCTCS